MLGKPKINRFRSTLGESREDYLEAILILGANRHPVRVKELARFLGVSCPSIVGALTGLKRQGLVRHEHYGGVELTPRGKMRAEAIYQRHLLLTEFLQLVLGVNPRVAAEDACRMEHTLSRETIKMIINFVQRKKNHEKVK